MLGIHSTDYSECRLLFFSPIASCGFTALYFQHQHRLTYLVLRNCWEWLKITGELIIVDRFLIFNMLVLQ